MYLHPRSVISSLLGTRDSFHGTQFSHRWPRAVAEGQFFGWFKCIPCIYVFVFGCAGSLLLPGLFSTCGDWWLHSSCGAQASHRSGFFCCGALACGLRISRCRDSVALPHVGSSRTRDRTHVSCTGRWIPYRWATRDVPQAHCTYRALYFCSHYISTSWDHQALDPGRWGPQSWMTYSPAPGLKAPSYVFQSRDSKQRQGFRKGYVELVLRVKGVDTAKLHN